MLTCLCRQQFRFDNKAQENDQKTQHNGKEMCKNEQKNMKKTNFSFCTNGQIHKHVGGKMFLRLPQL